MVFGRVASTCLNEESRRPDLIELQFAHAERIEIRAAYNRAQRPPENRTPDADVGKYLDRHTRRHRGQRCLRINLRRNGAVWLFSQRGVSSRSIVEI
jgi:hypothetical protein